MYSLILSQIDYCNALLHGAPASTVNKPQRMQNNAARVVLQSARQSDAKLLLCRLHWLPIKQRIMYKIAVVTFKVRTTATPAYLSCHLQDMSQCAASSIVWHTIAVAIFLQD